jgi:hypothetical protein
VTRPKGIIPLVLLALLLVVSHTLVACSEEQQSGTEPTSLPATTGVPSATTTPGPAPQTGGAAPAPLTGVVGKVVDMDSGEPVEGATVSAQGGSVLSAGDGSFRLEVPLTVGSPVLAEKEGYIAAERLAGPNRGDGYGTCQLELLDETSPNAPPVPPSS